MRLLAKFTLPLTAIALVVSFWHDESIFRVLAAFRLPPLDELMLFMTNRGLAALIVILTLYLIFQKKYLEFTLIILTVSMSMATAYLLKKVFQLPRPHAAELLNFTALAQAGGYSFPSLHATFCFSVLPFIRKIFTSKAWRILITATLLTIAISRVYLGVHFASDVAAGALIGLFSAKLWLWLQAKHRIIQWFVFHVKDKFELRRQIAHLATGVSIVVLLKYNWLNAQMLLAVLILGGIAMLISKKYRIPGIHQLLIFFERPKDLNYFPGKGSFFLVLGALLTVVLFPKDIAMAAIAIMALGDAVTTIIGTYFGRIKNPFNPGKHLEGTVLAVILATLAAFAFVNFEKAFIASVVGMLFESITVRFLDKIIDDNLLIPLVAGLAMTWIS